MKEAYHPPKLFEYGRIEELTLGISGSAPDNIIIGSWQININDDCNPNHHIPFLTCS